LILEPFGPEALAALDPRDQRTVIGHARHDSMSPLSEGTISSLIERIGSVNRLLDVGCGKGAFARRAVGSGRVTSALCIERNPLLAADGRRRAEQEGVGRMIDWVIGNASDWSPGERFDAVAVIGSSQALGGFNGALSFAVEHLNPRGRLVLGEGVWQAPPPSEYLRFLDTDGNDTPTPTALETAINGAGFRIVHVHRSTEEEWAAYEDPYFAALVRFATDNGERPCAAQAKAFSTMQSRYGRAALGFETILAVCT
jgi:SAM-dependent methyltransferase